MCGQGKIMGRLGGEKGKGIKTAGGKEMGTLFESELWIENSQKGKNEKRVRRGEEEESSH